jgi:ketosteroid isomerase-like protein
MKLLSILTAIFVTFIGGNAFTEEWSPAQKEVWKLEEAYWDARTKEDKEGALAFFHQNCSLWPTQQLSPIGKASIKLSTIRSLKLKPMAINLFGNVAIVHYHFSASAAGEDWLSRVTRVWMKENGKWLIIGGAVADCKYSAACGWRP